MNEALLHSITAQEWAARYEQLRSDTLHRVSGVSRGIGLVEGRPLIKENAGQLKTYATQSGKGVSQGTGGFSGLIVDTRNALHGFESDRIVRL